MTRVSATRLVVRGRVQGVGYRAWFAREAGRHHLYGWVRNRRDGSVEALVFAPAPTLGAFIEACRRGPPAAAVAEVLVSEESAPEAEVFADFAIWPTG